MAFLPGHSQPAFAVLPGGGSTANQPAGNPADVMNGSAGHGTINGAPVRIVVLALAAAAGLTVLKLAGFRFNVGVSS